ncbi:hypothetical protein H6771_02350 [Candidatus Peribacteria bacterium]|nr:hypothetical protein [Candidatus Peribacteria bacterium]
MRRHWWLLLALLPGAALAAEGVLDSSGLEIQYEGMGIDGTSWPADISFWEVPAEELEKADSLLRTQPNVIVQGGEIAENAVISDARGIVYIELPEGLRVRELTTGRSLEGRILAPEAVDRPSRSPEGGVLHLYSFMLETSTGRDVRFLDAFTAIHPRILLRRQYLYPEEALVHTPGVRVLMLMNTDVTTPKLYRWDETEKLWQKVGGATKGIGDNQQVFAAYLDRTGTYSVFDMNPLPGLGGIQYHESGVIELVEQPGGPSSEIPDWYKYAKEVEAHIEDHTEIVDVPSYEEVFPLEHFVDAEESTTGGTTDEEEMATIQPVEDTRVIPGIPLSGSSAAPAPSEATGETTTEDTERVIPGLAAGTAGSVTAPTSMPVSAASTTSTTATTSFPETLPSTGAPQEPPARSAWGTVLLLLLSMGAGAGVYLWRV